MKKFKFRLETLLKYRKILEDQARLELAEADRRLKEEQSKLKKLEDDLNRTIEALYQKQSETVTAEELSLYSSYISRLKHNITMQEIKVAEAEKYRFECLKKLEEAMRRRKLVESLKDKQLKNYYIELLREEQKYLDEIGTQISIGRKASVM